MNIIRTPAIELSVIPALAYKQKLAAGGAGIRVLRLDRQASGIFTIDRRSGEAKPYGDIDTALFPEEAIDEALELTDGLPYSARGKIVIHGNDATQNEQDVADGEIGGNAAVPDKEYQAIIERYRDEKGRINFRLMNKDFIQFAAKSKTVATMAANQALEDDLLRFIVKNRAAHFAGENEHLDDPHTDALIETLNEIAPRSAFKELKVYLRRLLARR